MLFFSRIFRNFRRTLNEHTQEHQNLDRRLTSIHSSFQILLINQNFLRCIFVKRFDSALGQLGAHSYSRRCTSLFFNQCHLAVYLKGKTLQGTEKSKRFLLPFTQNFLFHLFYCLQIELLKWSPLKVAKWNALLFYYCWVEVFRVFRIQPF